MAGAIYVFQRKDLYGLGRTAVLMGLLSYSFVMVTLIADLGLPWHSYQLALQAPGHSAMFEVSWCVGLYVTILLLEFLPIPFERWGFERATVAWRRWNGAYVAAAVTLFVYLLSRTLIYTFATALIFGALTVVSKNDIFIKMKPSVINLVFAAGLLGGYSSGSNILVATQTPRARTDWALGMMSSGMRVQITSHSLATLISWAAKPSASARSREASAWVKTSTASPESRRLRAHERPWLPYPTTATLCPSSTDRFASDS